MEFTFDIGSFLAGVLGGGGLGSLITYKWQKRQTVKGSGSVVDQTGATANGDIVGHDKNSR